MSVLIDTSVWVDHFRNGNAALAERFGISHRPDLH